MGKTLVLALFLVIGINFIAAAGHDHPSMIPAIGGGCVGIYVFLARLWSR